MECGRLWCWYNDNDGFAADWLEGLGAAGLISPGVVDRRSIEDVQASDVAGFTRCHFFAGIAGWDAALQLAGWPDERPVWTASLPCQPFSDAGKRQGESDERHLWPAFQRLVAECRPATIFGEQVASRLGREWLAGVRVDLEGMGYAVGAADLPAACVAAPHRRNRLFWVAYADGIGERDVARGLGQAESNEARQESEARRTTQTTLDSCTDNTDMLAYAEHERARGGIAGVEGQAGRGRHRLADDGTTGFVAHAKRQRAGSGIAREQGQARSGRDRLADDGAAGGLGNARGTGLEKRGSNGEIQCETMGAYQGQAALGASDYRESARVAAEQRSKQESQERERSAKDVFTTNAWDGCVTIPCGDGKAWRVPAEPALFPLADGLPGRVGILRGAGNAIVPQVAAAFIRAAIGESMTWAAG